MTAALAPGSQQFREMVVGEALRAAESAARLQLRIARVDLDFDIADPDVAPPCSRHCRTTTFACATKRESRSLETTTRQWNSRAHSPERGTAP